MKRKSVNLTKGSTDEIRKNHIIDKVSKEKGEELIRKIESGEYGVEKAGAGLGRSGKKGASSVDWSPAGRSLANGLSRGIRSRGGYGGSIWNTAWNLGKTALKAVKNAIDSHSPSNEKVSQESTESKKPVLVWGDLVKRELLLSIGLLLVEVWLTVCLEVLDHVVDTVEASGIPHGT